MPSPTPTTPVPAQGRPAGMDPCGRQPMGDPREERGQWTLGAAASGSILKPSSFTLHPPMSPPSSDSRADAGNGLCPRVGCRGRAPAARTVRATEGVDMLSRGAK